MASQDTSSPSSVALVLREVSSVADAEQSAGSKPARSRIGRYTLDARLEHDGVGAVYAAHDSKLDRRVALRVIPSSHEDGTPYSRSRLLRETRSMARLSHPNVVRILDVGATRRELFIAMELLDGESVPAWLTRSSPSWQLIVDTFVPAGRGLAAAHDAGFVHGDFDARHIQRTADGRVVVTDFGLTRARTRDDGMTNPGTDARLVRDDQNAFCAALYASLFSEPPPLRGSIEQRPAVRDSEVPGRIVRALARGLSRDRRYPSMKALLAGLEGPRKRNIAIGAAAAAVFVGAAAVAYGVAPGGDGQCMAQMPDGLETEARERLVSQLSTTTVPFAADSAALVGRELEAWVQAWSDAQLRACEVAPQAAPPPCLERVGQHGRALVVELQQADAVAIEHSVAAVLSLPAPGVCDDERRAELRQPLDAGFETSWATAWASHVLGRHDAAIGRLQQLQRDLRQRTELVDPHATARTLTLLGAAQASANSAQAASRTLSDAMDEATAVDAPWLHTQAALGLARVQITALQRVDAAVASLESAHGGLDAFANDAWLQAEFDVVAATVAAAQGQTPQARAHWAEAETAFESLGLRGQLHAADVAIERGKLEIAQGRYQDTMAHFRRAQRTRTDTLGLAHPAVADVLSEIAGGWIGQGELVTARDTLETAAAILEDAYPPEHPDVIRLHGRLALLLGLTGRTEASVAMFDAVIRQQTRRHGENSDQVAALLGNRGALLAEAGREDAARADLDRALSIRQVLGDERGQAGILGELASVAQRRGDHSSAEELALRSLEMHGKSVAKDHPMLSPMYITLGRSLESQGRRDEARGHLDHALAVITEAQGADHFNAAFPLAGLGRLNLNEEKPALAIEQLERAVNLLERGQFGARTEMEARLDLARAQWATGKKDVATQTAEAGRDRARTRDPDAVAMFDRWLSERD